MNAVSTYKKLLAAINMNRAAKLTVQQHSKIIWDGDNHTSKESKYYSISKWTWNTGKRKYTPTVIFTTASAIRVVFYLRDLFYINKGEPLPEADEMWEETRKRIDYSDAEDTNGQHRAYTRSQK